MARFAFGIAITQGLFGDGAGTFHAFNVLLHALNGFLVFQLLLALQRLVEPADTPDVTAMVAAGFGALLFVCHPLQVESVSWVTSLKDIGCATFALSALWAHVVNKRWLGVGALVLAGGLVFATQLRRLRRHARPVYARLGILPEAAAGVNAATELAPGPRA